MWRPNGSTMLDDAVSAGLIKAALPSVLCRSIAAGCGRGTRYPRPPSRSRRGDARGGVFQAPGGAAHLAGWRAAPHHRAMDEFAVKPDPDDPQLTRRVA